MFNKRLQKFSIRKLTVGAASVLIGISFVSMRDNSTVHAADMPAQATAQTSQDKLNAAKSEVDKAQTEVNNAQTTLNDAQSSLSDAQNKANEANKAYDAQNTKTTAAQKDADNKKQAFDEASGKVSDAQKLVNESKNPNAKENAQKAITDKENALTQAQDAEKAAENKANDAAQKVENASKDVNSKQSDFNTKQTHKDQADNKVTAIQDALNTSVGQAAKDLDSANARVAQDQADLNQANDKIKKSTQDQGIAKDKLADAQSAVEQAQKNQQNAQANYDQLNKLTQTSQSQLDEINNNKAQLEGQLSDLQDKSKNNVVISDIEKFKQVYSHGEIMSDEDFEWTKKENENNHFIHSEADKKELVYPNKLTEDQIKELSLFIADLQSKVRTQLGFTPVAVTKGAIEMAKEIAKGYVKDRWDDYKTNPNAGWHDEDAIDAAQDKFDSGTTECFGGSFVESLRQDGYPVTMDELKRGAYDLFLYMILPKGKGTIAPGKTVYELGHGYGLLGIESNNNELIDTSTEHANENINYVKNEIQEYKDLLTGTITKDKTVYSELRLFPQSLPHYVAGAAIMPRDTDTMYEVLLPTKVVGVGTGEHNWKLVNKDEFDTAVKSIIKECENYLVQQKEYLKKPTYYSATIYESSATYKTFVTGHPEDNWETPTWRILFENQSKELVNIDQDHLYDTTIIPSYADQITNVNKELEALNNKLATLQTQVNTDKDSINNAKQKLGEAQEALQSAKASVNNAQTSYNNATNALDNANKLKQSIQSKLSQDLATKDKKQSIYNEAIANHKQKLNDLNAAITEQKNAAELLKNAQDALIKAQDKLSAAKQTQSKLNDDVNSKKTAVQTAQKAVKNAQEYLANLNNAPELLATALNGQKIAQNNYDTAKKNADNEATQLGKLKQAKDSADDKVKAAQGVVNTAEQNLASAKNDLSNAQNAYTAIEDEIASENAAVNNNKTTASNSEEPMTGVAHIKNTVTLVNGKGELGSQIIDANTDYKVFAKKTINGKTYYRLGTDNQWVVADAVASITPNIVTNNDNAETPLAAIGYIPVLKNHPTWKIALVDGNGNYTGQYLATNTNWKVFAKKTINGQTYYRLGTENQWLPAAYLQVKTSGVVKANPVKNHPTWKIALLNHNGEYTGEFVKPNTTWKVWDIMFINGRMMARIGSQSQWIPMEFVSWVK